MSAALTATGWLAALAALAGAAVLQRELGRRGELVARACHELRGPLTSARLGLALLSRTSASARDSASAIDGELRRAGLALDDLHAARAGRRARDRREAVSVEALVQETVEAWRPVADAAGTVLRLQVDAGGAAVRGDRLRLGQACGNLLANAIEHGGGHVVVRASADIVRARIEVCDDGPGLAAPVAELTRGAHGGRGRRGRGLAIAAEIAARHGGRLAAAPATRGARLALDLPVAAAARRAQR